MEFHIFSTVSITCVALFSGLIFGFLLQKGGVGRFDTIVGQLLLKDFTVMKVIFTAILVGSIGIYSLNAFGALPAFHLSKTSLLMSAAGGGLFGVGMSVLGFCPGTAFAALANGSKDMVFGLLGMLVGSALYNEISQFLPESRDPFFQKTVADVFGVSPALVIGAIGIGWILLKWLTDRYEKKEAVLQ